MVSATCLVFIIDFRDMKQQVHETLLTTTLKIAIICRTLWVEPERVPVMCITRINKI